MSLGVGAEGPPGKKWPHTCTWETRRRQKSGWVGAGRERQVDNGQWPLSRLVGQCPWAGLARQGESGCGVLLHWYRQVLKQQVGAPTSWLPPSCRDMAGAETGAETLTRKLTPDPMSATLPPQSLSLTSLCTLLPSQPSPALPSVLPCGVPQKGLGVFLGTLPHPLGVPAPPTPGWVPFFQPCLFRPPLQCL